MLTRPVTGVLNDLRSAARGLIRAPALTAVLVISLAFGAGANAMLFSMAEGLLFRTPAIGDPAGLVSVHTAQFGGGAFGFSSYPDFESIARDPGPLEQVAASDEGHPQPVRLPIASRTSASPPSRTRTSRCCNSSRTPDGC